MSVHFDLSDIHKNIKADELITEQEILELTQKLTLDVQKDLVLATPVDTGRARQGWEATTPTTVNEQGIVENNVPYLIHLNDGHSDQAPANFVEQIVQRYNGRD